LFSFIYLQSHGADGEEYSNVATITDNKYCTIYTTQS
jgi:hypothetical protein